MKYLIVLVGILICSVVFAQTNTFPTSGSVGIGTTTPNAVVDIISNGNGLGFGLNFRNSDLSYKFRIRDDGNWAIGNDASVDGNFAGAIYGGALGLIGSNSSSLLFRSSTGGTNLKNWYMGASPTSFMIRTLNDGYNTLLTPLTITRDGNVGIGTLTPSSTLHIKGVGSTNNASFIIVDNADVERMKVLDNGETVWQAGTNEEVKIGTNGFIYPGGSSIRNMYIRNAGSNLLEINGNNTPTLRFGASSFPTAIRGGNSTINTPVFGVGTSFSAGMGFSNPTTGEVGVTLFYDDNISTKAGFTLSSQGRWGMTLTPEQDDALTQILVRDSGTGEVKYRDASSLAGGSSIWASSGSNAFFDTGNIGIGIDNPQNKLDVNGTIHAKEVKVDLTGWPDYVFAKDYDLQPLEEVKHFIEQNQHLPEMPSAKEVEVNGVMLGEMNKLLLKKVEELTLYLLELKEENIDLRSRLDNVEKMIEN